MRLRIQVSTFCFLLLNSFSLLAQKQFITSFDGVRIAYLDEGEGPAVILLHGFINTADSWSDSVLKKELLSKGFRLIIPDLRGNGDSDKPQLDSAYKDDAEIRDLLLLADTLRLKKYSAVGYSRGSIVLAKLLTIDKRIEKAVLGGMGLDFSNPNWDRKQMFAAAFNGKTSPETQGAVDYAKSIGADLRSLHLQQKHQPVTAVNELSKIKAQILVIAGDRDKDNGEPETLRDAIPKSSLHIVSGDHNGTYKKEEFATAILQFL